MALQLFLWEHFFGNIFFVETFFISHYYGKNLKKSLQHYIQHAFYTTFRNEHGLPMMEGEVGPPGDDVRNYHRDYKDRDYRSQEYTNREYDRDYERDYIREYDRDDQDRERRRRSRY